MNVPGVRSRIAALASGELIVGFEPEQVRGGVAGNERAAGVFECRQTTRFDDRAPNFGHHIEIRALLARHALLRTLVLPRDELADSSEIVVEKLEPLLLSRDADSRGSGSGSSDHGGGVVDCKLRHHLQIPFGSTDFLIVRGSDFSRIGCATGADDGPRVEIDNHRGDRR